MRGNKGGRRDGERPRGRGPFRERQGPPSRRRETSREAPPRPPKSAERPPGARLAGVEELEVRIEKLVAGGEGLARFEAVPVFVPRSAPGDLLRVRIVERRPDYGRAEIIEILEPGRGRRPDPVPELSGTGVCDLQHLDDRVQPILKAEAVRETLQRLGRLTVPAGSPLFTGEPWGYRLRTQLHTESDPAAGGVRVGYYARGTNDVIPVARCPLLVPELEELLAALPQHLGASAPQRLDLAAGDDRAVTVSPLVPGLPHGEVSTQVGEITYAYDARCFFQSHRGLLPRLVETTVGSWEGELAVDLYAGVGLFSLPLAGRYRQVIAIEADQIGARYARLNAKRNHLGGVEVVNQSVETWLPRLPADVDRLILDPPRSGLTPRARDVLMARRPARMTYVSCHPAALARDLSYLQEGYDIESVAFIDLFPQTGHMEVVVQMAALRTPSKS